MEKKNNFKIVFLRLKIHHGQNEKPLLELRPPWNTSDVKKGDSELAEGGEAFWTQVILQPLLIS